MYKSYYSIVPLKDVFKHITNGFDFRDYQVAGTPYIKVANVKPGHFDFSNLNYIDLNTNDISKKIQLKRGNLLLTRKGTFGNALSIDVDYEYIISSEIFYLELHKNIVNSKYLEIVLNSNIGQEQFDRFKIGAIMGSLSQEAIKYIKVPLPPKEIQQEVVNIYNAAYKQKQAKEADAKALLASIDDYLLAELGITLPEQDNSLQKRTFITNFSKLTGSRFDPIFLKSSINLLLAGTYKSDLLKSVALSFKSGVGAGKQDQSLDDNGIIQIRPTNIDVNGELKFDKNVYLPSLGNYSSNDFAIYSDVLFNNTNSQELVGKTAVLSLSKRFLFSNHITRIRVNTEKLNPNYLSLILNLYQSYNVFYSICTNWNNQSGVGLEILKNIKIPVPPLEKQQEIAEHIRTIRQKAKQLQEDGASILADVKIQVEQMILGVK